MTAEVLGTKSRQIQRKFIPILRTGSWKQSAPSWLQGKYRIHLDGDPYPEEQYQDLLATLHDARPKPPPLGSRPEKYQIQELRKHLNSPDVDERLFAIKTLQKIGPAAVPALVAVLKDDDAKVRRRATYALGRIGPAADAAIPDLVAAIKDATVEVRRVAVSALGRIGPAADAAIPDLVAALSDDDAKTQKSAAFALGRIGRGRPAVPALVAALKDEDSWVRQSAAFALGESVRRPRRPCLLWSRHSRAKTPRYKRRRPLPWENRAAGRPRSGRGTRRRQRLGTTVGGQCLGQNQ